VKLTVLIATTEQFADHAAVADGASDLFVQIFGRETGHVRLVYGVQSLPIGAPVIVDTVFEIEVPPLLNLQTSTLTKEGLTIMQELMTQPAVSTRETYVSTR